MNRSNPSVLLISVDALKPEFVLAQQACGVHLPHLQQFFVEKGCYAGQGVKSVFPTFTYPCHQSIITGTTPRRHGITNNILFDPYGTRKGAWHWFVSPKVQNLWEEAKKHGYLSASAAFPTSVGAKGDYIAPEFWWDGTELDSQFIDALSVPQGLIAEMEQEIGRYAGGLDLTPAGDEQRYRAAAWLLDHKLSVRESGKPFFLTGYFASFDEMMHICGVHSKEAAHCLETIDRQIGLLIEKAKQAAEDHLVVAVVSDHGSLDNDFNISPNVLFVQEGLITLDVTGHLQDWQVFSQRAGGCSEVRLKHPADAQTRQTVEALLHRLVADPAQGILEVLDRPAIEARGGFDQADYVLVSRKGYEIRDNLTGSYQSTTVSQKAQHGYSEAFDEMRASFMIWGHSIAAGRDLGAMELIDIAPTLAELMGFTLETAQGQSVLGRIKQGV